MGDKRLAIYLNDHLAGSCVGSELVRRAQRENEGSDLGRFLAGLVEQIDEDRRELERVMVRVGARRSRVKPALAWAAEKVGRLKLNGQVTGYSPLSRVVELEGLALGITGKKALWVSLEELKGRDERLAGFDFATLIRRADEQLRGVDEHRRAAVRQAF